MELPRPAPFRPALWAPGPHFQTILSDRVKTPMVPVPGTPEFLEVEPGEKLRLEVAEGLTDTVIVLLHGLGGNAGSYYLRRSAARAVARGHGVISVNHRGTGLGRGLARKPYHCGATKDVAAVIAHARQRFPGRKIIAVGFSLSAAMLVLLTGRDHHLAQPDAAMAVNPPGDLDVCSLRMLHGLNRVYDLRFLKLMHEHVAGVPDAPDLPDLHTLRDFDEAYTAPQAGFASRQDYYAQCSCGPYLAGIHRPFVLLASLDDPFAPASDLGPISPSVHAHIERQGGHCGYLGHEPSGGFRWMNYAVDHYLEALRSRI